MSVVQVPAYYEVLGLIPSKTEHGGVLVIPDLGREKQDEIFQDNPQ